MRNMSYCRFQNTAKYLNDCVEALEMQDIESLSTSEQRAAQEIKRLCIEYLELYSAACGDEK